MDRRDFLRISAAGTMLGALPEALAAKSAGVDAWDRGRLKHLLPTVSDREILVKASFDKALAAPPVLGLGSRKVPGRAKLP